MEIGETLQAIDVLSAKLKDLSEQHRRAMAAADIALVNRIQTQIGELTRQKEELMADFQNKRS
jgi:hypothetical protein